MPHHEPEHGNESLLGLTFKATGLPTHFTPHRLRHTFASIPLSDGLSSAYVQRMLGHSSIRLTVDLYGRWERGSE